MGTYRLASLAQLARQMEFAPQEVRSAQLAKAEELLHAIEPIKAYPLDFVIYRITDYRPKSGGEELLTGLALQHDLGLLIERVSDGMNVRTDGLSQPVLSTDDIAERFNITTKTIQRWRRKGLSARRFIFPDGKKRVGFLLSSVEQFLLHHGDQVAAGNLSQIDEAEKDTILRHAGRLAAGCDADEIARRIARITHRSPLTILHTLRKHDQEHPESAILPHAVQPLTPAQKSLIINGYRQGMGITELAAQLAVARPLVYRVVMEDRVERLTRHKVRFCDDPLFHQPDAAAAIEAIVSQEELAEPEGKHDLRLPRDLPPYLHDLCRAPLLSKGKERALFLKFNFHKYQFMKLRRRLDPELAGHRDLHRMERQLALATQARNAILRANLRLVVSVARRHLRPGVMLGDLISEGNLTLMRAVESFDIARGNRFSTYATLALMKGFARSVPQLLAASRQSMGDPERLMQLPDARPTISMQQVLERDHVRQVLSRLDDRERTILAAHFGLDESAPASYEQVGQRLGLCKERVRQIEAEAMSKLKRELGDAGVEKMM